MKSLMILIIGAVVIGMSAMTVVAEETLSRDYEIKSPDVTIQEQNTEEPVLIAPAPDSETTDEEPVLIAPSPVSEEEPNLIAPGPDDGSETSLILPAESSSKSTGTIKNAPAIFILRIVGFLVILLLVINRRK